ncbi:AraC family transcriptional regulator [Luteithermobacter gelatinilyticus]|uniref:AraC family transcriptional regulator n=1 Tax=Luteithermobacter gelatinilyticus TaxID=2582913 RepID=UPI001105E2C2|nr:AraC family transcriptional regulator [Luteithermobacter gelatinilyticus]
MMTAPSFMNNPLNNHKIFRSSDIEETKEVVSQFLWPHYMKINNARKQVNTRLDGLSLDKLGLLHLHYGANVEVNAGEISDYYLIQTTLKGNGAVRNGLRSTRTGVGISTIVSPSEETHVKLYDDCHHLILRIKREAIETHLCRLLQTELRQPLVFDLSIWHSTPMGSLLINTINYICNLYNVDISLVQKRAISDQFTDLVMTLLLFQHHHNYSNKMESTEASATPWHVKKAREYIEDKIHENITLADLTSYTNVTARTLQNSFKRFLDTTPTEYIRQVRLKRIHEELQTGTETTSVTDIMLKYGVNNIGRFATYYKKRYGCLPSETLRKRLNK